MKHPPSTFPTLLLKQLLPSALISCTLILSPSQCKPIHSELSTPGDIINSPTEVLCIYLCSLEVYHYFHFHLQLQSLLHSPEGLNKWWAGLAGLLSEEQSDGAWSVHSPGHLQAAVRMQEGIRSKMGSGLF